MESDHDGSDDIMGNGQMILGSEVAPKVFAIIYGVELGKPFVFPNFRVGISQGTTMAQRVEETVKSE